jgi:predicted AlkP superfamily pyrophosphatase or phosphodiesterase|tara:strand:+ start:15088 stop:16182 length:1095 start_codon:yes stop_codon:yes gene_type:complete
MDHLDNIFGKRNLLDLSKKVFNTVLNEDVFYEENEVNLNSEIFKAETINFVLADGLGTENLKMSRSDFLNNSNSFSVNSTFPSSTNVALSTINYVSKPVDTGILGYYLFDENEHGLINALNWNQENKSILKDVDIKDNKTIWTILKSKGVTSNNIQPKDLIHSALSEYIYKDSHQIAYKDTEELNEIISDSSVLDNRFNFIYYPNIDISAHVFGVGSEEWHEEIDIFEKFIKNLNNSHSRKMYTLITADHGLTNIPQKNRVYLDYTDEIKIFGDQRSVYINGDSHEVEKVFKDVPGRFLTSEEITKLLGNPQTDLSKRLYPDHCFLLEDGYIVFPKHLKGNLVGYHGGTTPEEMNVPVIEIMNY